MERGLNGSPEFFSLPTRGNCLPVERIFPVRAGRFAFPGESGRKTGIGTEDFSDYSDYQRVRKLSSCIRTVSFENDRLIRDLPNRGNCCNLWSVLRSFSGLSLDCFARGREATKSPNPAQAVIIPQRLALLFRASSPLALSPIWNRRRHLPEILLHQPLDTKPVYGFAQPPTFVIPE